MSPTSRATSASSSARAATRRDATDWIARSPLLAADDERLMRRKVLSTYGEAIGLGEVG